MNLRFDLILSYWIFAWFLLYLYDVVPYSPHLALILALLFEIGILCAMVFNHASNYYIGLFVIITIIIKAIPIYILRNEQINYFNQMIYMGCVIALYMLWLKLNNQNAIEYFTYQMSRLVEGKATTPAISIIYPYMMKFLRI